MNNFIFENATKTYFGTGCVKEYLATELNRYGKKVLLAYGTGSIKKNGIYDEVITILKEAGKEIFEFDGIMPNPTYDKVLEGAEIARTHQVDMILGVGGGSVLDCCKAISLAARTLNIWEHYFLNKGVIEAEPLPLGVVVTAAGTGSEMNGGAVITHVEQKVKMGRDYPILNPRFAFLDPVYTMSVPIKQMVSGAFDAMCHVMEIYFSEPDEDNVSDDIAEALMRSIIRNIKMAVADPKDYVARSNLLWASTMAKNRIIKLGKRTDFQAHHIEHQLVAYTNCNHGQGLAVILPRYYRKIYTCGLTKFMRFAKHVWDIEREHRTDEAYARAGLDALENFMSEMGLPRTLKEIGIHEQDLQSKGLLSIIAQSCLISTGSYKQLTRSEILEILKDCLK